ncbi:hypothetical protein CKM354_000801800 [Cercospora kikuchii]|uniref:Amidohydrolase-related domain-containing protein n=1 Tax=Cercospora kikuchii TaxID=84275 RepID=A0A9P3CKE8_9PEZI|nr:uncharacterized protein CKM354_000801800 [Cercospora kikuchii]GIZ44832.1 hypothetical protein CKM354_000801800 [Cercospora kikuchii]
MEKIIKPWLLDPPTPYVFKNANILDVTSGEILPNATLIINDGKVSRVGTTRDATLEQDIPQGSAILDIEGKFIMPGLIDCHVHIAVTPGYSSLESYNNMSERESLIRQPTVLKAMLQRGFTTVRDCGGATSAMRAAIEEGVLPGPRLFVAGRALSQTGGHGDMRGQQDERPCCGGELSGISRIVDGVPECLRVARDEIRKGSDFLKIMGGGGVASPTDRIEDLQFSDEEIRAIVTVAQNVDTYVTSHCYTPRAIQQALRQGVRGIEHGNYLDIETAKLMKESGAFLTPTLVAHEMAKQMNFFPAASADKNLAVYMRGLEAIRIATEVGVTVCYGSDLLGPTHLAQSKEFAIRSTVQTPLQIIQSATINAAKLLQREDSLGQVKQGFLADFLILPNNPLENLTALDSSGTVIVFKDGRLVSGVLDQDSRSRI